MGKKKGQGAVTPAVVTVAPAGVAPLGDAPKLRAIDIIRSNFTAALRSIEIREWADPQTGEPLVLQFGPLTISDYEAIAAPEGKEQSGHTHSLRLLIHKAKRADGSPAFMPGDLHYLQTEAPAELIQRVVEFMYSHSVVSHAEAKAAIKNADGSASSSTSPRSLAAPSEVSTD